MSRPPPPLHRAPWGSRARLSAQHLCLDVQRAVEGFIYHNTSSEGPDAFYSQLGNPTFVAKNAIYITNTLVGDAFMALRLYVIWNRVWWIAVPPAVLILATAGEWSFWCGCEGLWEGGRRGRMLCGHKVGGNREDLQHFTYLLWAGAQRSTQAWGRGYDHFVRKPRLPR